MTRSSEAFLRIWDWFSEVGQVDARSMNMVHSGAQACIMQTSLHQLTLHTSIMWKSSRENVVKFEVFRDPSFGNVDVGGIFSVPVSAS